MTDPTSSNRARGLSRIIVPLDGSPCGDRALRFGFALAQRGGLPVTIVHVHGPADDRPAIAAAEAHLAGVKDRFAAVADCDVAMLSGGPADVVLELAQELDALVCMASHGRRGLARLVLGSVAEDVLRRSEGGLAIVGPRSASFALPGEPVELVFCTDGSPHATQAAPATARLAQLVDASVTVLRQVPPDEDVTADDSPPPRPNLDEARAHCHQLQAYFGSEGIPTTSKVLFGDPVGSIVDEAASRAASIIALGSHGRAGLDRFAAGSLTARLVRRSPCPVFVVGPAAAEPIDLEAFPEHLLRP